MTGETTGAGEITLAADPFLADVPTREGYKVLGGVVLYQKLGQGGMGAVYRGRHARLNIDVAVKVMTPPTNFHTSAAGDFVKRFIREAQTAAAVSHQGLVRVYDVDAECGVYFLIMEYVDGESAGERLERKGELAEAEAVEIALGAAEGLAEAHRRGVVHRDIKPDNIMVSKEGRVQVTDLGLAKAISTEEEDGGRSFLTQTQTAMGTPHYMPPEQFESARDVGATADVWSLGVTLYHLLTGSPPWTESSVFRLATKIQSAALSDPRERRAGLSDGVCSIMEKALKKEPAARYSDCVEMAAALRAHLDSIKTSAASVLPDPEAGSARTLLASMATPPSGVIAFTGESLTGADSAGTPGSMSGPAAPAGEPARTETLPGATRRTVPASQPPETPAASGRGGGAGITPIALLLVAVLGGGGAAAWYFLAGPGAGPPDKRVEDAGRDKPVERDEPVKHVKRVEHVEHVEPGKAKPDGGAVEGARPPLSEEEKKLAAYGDAMKRAASHSDAGRWEDAAAAFREALELKPGDAEAARLGAEAEKRIGPAKTLTLDLGGGVTMDIVLVPAGRFVMGSPKTEQQRGKNEGPQHEVKITGAFYMGKYEVTQAQYESVMGRNPSLFKDPKNPVEQVVWKEAAEFCAKLSQRTGREVRLPTEAEWEYACRAGTTTPFHFGRSLAPDQASFDGRYPYGGVAKGDARRRTTPAGSFPANAWGLRDMHGNVWEWCADWLEPEYYRNSPAEDPTGPDKGRYRVLRGGAWLYRARSCRSAQREKYFPADRSKCNGFRVVSPAQGQ